MLNEQFDENGILKMPTKNEHYLQTFRLQSNSQMCCEILMKYHRN